MYMSCVYMYVHAPVHAPVHVVKIYIIRHRICKHDLSKTKTDRLIWISIKKDAKSNVTQINFGLF